jgi:hypothetical protein
LLLVFPQSFRYLFLLDPRLCQLALSPCSSDCNLLLIRLDYFAINLECFFFKALTSYPILLFLHNSSGDLALDVLFCKPGKRLLQLGGVKSDRLGNRAYNQRNVILVKIKPALGLFHA